VTRVSSPSVAVAVAIRRVKGERRARILCVSGIVHNRAGRTMSRF